MLQTFPGFTVEALDFLTQVRENNNRDWFAPRKSFYEEQLKAPMEALVHAVAAGCLKKGLPLFAKERSPVSRIYRDTRFSPDKRPYQHHVGAALHGRVNGLPFGEMYMHITPEGSFLAAGFYMPDAAFLRAARARIADQPAAFEAVVKALAGKGLSLSEEGQLKRMPRGFERFAGLSVAPYLRLNNLVVSRKLEPDEVLSPNLVQTAVKFAVNARPILEYGWMLGYRPPARRDAESL